LPEILYEDEYIIAVNKPAGMLAQRDSTGRVSLQEAVTDYLKEKCGEDGDVYCVALNRLDRPVSGIMLFAKTPVAAGRLSEDIKERRIRKFYCALVSPPPGKTADNQWINLNQYIVRKRDRGYIAYENAPGAEAVSLRYRIMDTSGFSALILVELITGKRHQIRVQLSSLGTPIIGDKFYGSKEIFEDGNISLHAHYLSFRHPMTHQQITVTAPLPLHMKEKVLVSPEFTDYTGE